LEGYEIRETEWNERWRTKIITLMDAKLVGAVTSIEFYKILKKIETPILVAAFKFEYWRTSEARRILSEALVYRMMEWEIGLLVASTLDENLYFAKTW